MGASVDISERRKLEENLAFQALHDSLTGLPNRRMFVDHLDNSLSRASRSGKRTAVLFIDLDDFKAVNDRIGHLAGDNVPRRVGELIGGVLRAGDVAARLGGDEFVVCCDDLEGPEDAYVVADRISKVLAEPFPVGDDVTVASASIGVALSGLHSSAEGLVRNADIATRRSRPARPGWSCSTTPSTPRSGGGTTWPSSWRRPRTWARSRRCSSPGRAGQRRLPVRSGLAVEPGRAPRGGVRAGGEGRLSPKGQGQDHGLRQPPCPAPPAPDRRAPPVVACAIPR